MKGKVRNVIVELLSSCTQGFRNRTNPRLLSSTPTPASNSERMGFRRLAALNVGNRSHDAADASFARTATARGCNPIEKHRRTQANQNVRTNHLERLVNIGVCKWRGLKHMLANWSENPEKRLLSPMRLPFRHPCIYLTVHDLQRLAMLA